jgi:cell division protein FtsL
MRERKRKFSGNYKGNLILGKASFLMIAIVLMFAIGLLYLSQSNSIAVKGASHSELEARKAKLEKERDRLQVEATRLQSLQEIGKTLNKEDGTSDYVPVTKINYLPSSNVAVK